MTERSAHAPSPAPGFSTSGTAAAPTSGAEFAALFRDHTNRQIDDGHITTVDASLNFNIADFCQRHNCQPHSYTRDWFGFGTIDVLFVGYAGTLWTSFADAHKVSGADYADLKDMFAHDYLDDDGYRDVDQLVWTADNDGAINVLPLVQHSFLMRAMLAGPWSREFMGNTMNLFRHAALNTGLADVLGSVVLVRDGEAAVGSMSFADVIGGGDPLPSEEEARAQAARGPAGAL